jgi:hypothetical protein
MLPRIIVKNKNIGLIDGFAAFKKKRPVMPADAYYKAIAVNI